MLQVELVAIITGHGSDEYGCGEFCVTSHHFLVNSMHNNTLSFDSAGKQQQMKDACDGICTEMQKHLTIVKTLPTLGT